MASRQPQEVLAVVIAASTARRQLVVPVVVRPVGALVVPVDKHPGLRPRGPKLPARRPPPGHGAQAPLRAVGQTIATPDRHLRPRHELGPVARHLSISGVRTQPSNHEPVSSPPTTTASRVCSRARGLPTRRPTTPAPLRTVGRRAQPLVHSPVAETGTHRLRHRCV